MNVPLFRYSDHGNWFAGSNDRASLVIINCKLAASIETHARDVPSRFN